MKTFKQIMIFSLFLLIFSSNVSASTLNINEKNPIMIGEVGEVYCYDDANYGVLIRGFFKGCEVYQTELVAIISKETKITRDCNANPTDYKIKVGDIVYVEVDNMMTKSIPPQSPAKFVHVSTSKN